MSKDKIIELSKTKTVSDIARELNVSKQHVSQTLKRYRDKQPTPEPKSQEPSPAPIPAPLPSPPEPRTETQVQGPAPAAHEEKEPEPPKPTIKKEPKEPETKMNDIPEFDDLIKFCFEHIQDADCQTFLAHNLPPRQERALTEEQRLKLGITEIRKGGGHSGATKIALTILRKMRNQ